METPVKAVVLAAGRGTRLRTEGSDIPKVMRSAAGRPLLHYVLRALSFIPREDTVIVVGYRREQIISAFPDYAYAVQKEQLGTGHAVMAACETLKDYHGDVLVCCGDMPLIRRETYLSLLKSHRASGGVCTILSGTSDSPRGYGRVLRDERGDFAAIVEEKDCTAEQLAAAELNSGVYIFEADALSSVLGRLRSDNAQGEYYLTDAPGLLKADGMRVHVCRAATGQELLGVNTQEQLEMAERLLESP